MLKSRPKIYKEFPPGDCARISDPEFRKGKEPVRFLTDLAFVPATDVWETDKDMCVMIEIADLRLKNFRITYHRGFLVIEGSRPEPRHMQDSEIIKFHKKEIDYGNFLVKIKMNTRIDHNRISARHKNGMLFVRLPKSAGGGTPGNVEIPVSEG